MADKTRCGDYGGKKWDGSPCRSGVVLGSTRCAMHGGKNPASRIRAELLASSMRIPALEALFGMLDQLESDTCPACMFPRKDADEKKLLLAVIRTVLDRTGMGPSSKLELTNQTDGALDLRFLSEAERTELVGIIARVGELKALVRKRMAASPSEVPLGAESTEAAPTMVN